jgi:hypothetical protein
LRLLRSALRSRAQFAAENLFLQKQLAAYVERKVRRERTDDRTRVALVYPVPKLINPQAGFAFGFRGADAQASPVRVTPKSASTPRKEPHLLFSGEFSSGDIRSRRNPFVAPKRYHRMEVRMQEAQNTQVVKDAYAAFGRGDVQGILDKLDDGIVWNAVYGAGATFRRRVNAAARRRWANSSGRSLRT